MSEPFSKRLTLDWRCLVAIAATLSLMLWLSTWTGEGALTGPSTMFSVAIRSAFFSALWMMAAFGFGWPVERWLRQGLHRSRALQFAIGAAVLLWMDSALGSIGFLQVGRSVGAWLVTGVGLTLAIGSMIGHADRPNDRSTWSAGFAWWMAAAPAAAVAFVAACSAPGWLWATEFGGYDALSYHLQLPKEWLSLGRIEPLKHNVYSFLPSYVEAAYYHLMVLRGSSLDAAYSCQWLHTMIMVAAACSVSEMAARITPRSLFDGIALPLVLGVPWIIVVGSLAYNEMFVLLFFGASLTVLFESRSCCSWRCALMIGILASAACGAKLTAAGLVVAPIIVTGFVLLPARRWGTVLVLAAAVGALGMLPYFVRNAMTGGNPVFPFLTSVFGSAHWTADQVARFQVGHGSDLGFGDRLIEFWNQVVRFGIGTAPPASDDPWRAQWSVLLPAALVAAVAGWHRKAHRRAIAALLLCIAVQILFWLAFTHLKSRFLLPMVVPAVALLLLGVDRFASTRGQQVTTHSQRFGVLLGVIGALLWCWQPVMIFAREGRPDLDQGPASRVGLLGVVTGNDLSRNAQLQIAPQQPPVFLNHLLGSKARVLLVCEAMAFPYQAPMVYTTVWDRGPLSQAMAASDRPEDWLERLQRDGFTHLYIDAGMMSNWYALGWSDPNLNPDRIIEWAERFMERVHVFDASGSRLLYELPTRR